MSERYEEEFCCILRLCCGGHGDRKAKQALANKMVRELSPIDPATAARVADWFIETFDLSTPGSLKQIREDFAGMAREYAYNEG